MSVDLFGLAFLRAAGGWGKGVISYSIDAALVELECAGGPRFVRLLALLLEKCRVLTPFAPDACWAEEMGVDYVTAQC